MIVKMRAEDIKGTNLKVVATDREVQGYIKIVSPLTELADCIKKFDSYSKVVAFDVGYLSIGLCIDTLNELGVSCQTPILLKYEVMNLENQDETLAEICNLLDLIKNPVVRLVAHFPDDYCNMLVPYTLSKKYGGRVATCGGNFIRLPDCSIGCIQPRDIKGRMFNSLKLVCKDCACVLPTVEFEGAEVIWGSGELKKSSSGSKQSNGASKPKKALSSLFALGTQTTGSGYSNF